MLQCSAHSENTMSYLWSYVYYVFLRRMFKWCMHILTGKCELQRITEAQTSAASRVLAIGWYFVIFSAFYFMLFIV